MNKKNGQIALLVTLVILGAILSIGLGLTLVTIKEMKMASNIEESAMALQAADAGVEYVSYRINNSLPIEASKICPSWTNLDNGAFYCINTDDPDPKSIGRFGNIRRAIKIRSFSRIDILAGAAIGNMHYATNNGTGYFTFQWSTDACFAGFWTLCSLTSADFDNDGDIDILSGCDNGNMSYFTNDGIANFTFQWSMDVSAVVGSGVGIKSLTSADFDNDGDFDILVGDFGRMYYFTNDGTGNFTFQWSMDVSAVVGFVFSVR